MTEIAKVRWRYVETIPESGFWFWRKPRRYVFETGEGDRFEVSGDENAIDYVSTLPWDYYELGQNAADFKLERHIDKRESEARLDDALAAVGILQQRLEAASDESLIPILTADLEKALNFMMRFAQSLGMQAQGPLYDEMQSLLSKYKMTYHAPTREQIIREAIEQPGWARDEVIQASFNPETGKLDMMERTVEGQSHRVEERYLPEHNDDDGDPS